MALGQQKRQGVLTRPVAESLNDIGDVYCAMENIPRALEHYREALTVAVEVGNRNLLTVVTKNMGR